MNKDFQKKLNKVLFNWVNTFKGLPIADIDEVTQSKSGEVTLSFLSESDASAFCEILNRTERYIKKISAELVPFSFLIQEDGEQVHISLEIDEKENPNILNIRCDLGAILDNVFDAYCDAYSDFVKENIKIVDIHLPLGSIAKIKSKKGIRYITSNGKIFKNLEDAKDEETQFAVDIYIYISKILFI